MIDSGASHNFISSSLVSTLQIPVKGTAAYEVTVGDGHKVKGSGVCKGVKIEVQGTEIEQNFYLFELGGVDMILGIAWLESLGEVRVNWRQLTMKYQEGDALVCLKGDASLAKTEVSYRSMLKSVRKGGQGFVLELGKLETQTEAEREKQGRSSEVQILLDEFKEVCEPLKSLPPRRFRDHAIVVKEGTVPPNIRPYRHPHSQKAEIEKLQRIIDPDQQKWVSKLMGYNFEIQYKPGVENKAADALSRRGETLELKAFSVWQCDEFDEWEHKVQRDEHLAKIKQQGISGEKPPTGYALQNGFLVYNGRLILQMKAL
ncbi:Retrovirus-related Pol polyprotein from transposon 17.6 [Senna tora]|uniref:Retrovirus-related Pol polyprotein from transposon 17.6 n=1 Tax=Senna tora TaxID=362788 RepID=A0A834WWF0_9FABA|nr:Retrovirus-related Pol polyprotein from transposon 17.6 [Senna tora]